MAADKYPIRFRFSARVPNAELKRAERRMGRAIERFERGLTRISADIRSKMEAEAIALAPKRTGDLRSSIKAEVRREVQQWVVELRANADGKAPHAGFVEYGTSKMSAQPYLRPVIEKYRPIWRAEVLKLRRECFR
jgi:HK97 gp10 family phage protein